jgi:predicted NAD/FAD-dependent oxidoreductase
LAPTKLEACSYGDDKSFLMDEELMIFQAGDMMSTYTPGFESAALSGLDAATCLWRKLSN